jgi:hypothetical protein
MSLRTTPDNILVLHLVNGTPHAHTVFIEVRRPIVDVADLPHRPFEFLTADAQP